VGPSSCEGTPKELPASSPGLPSRHVGSGECRLFILSSRLMRAFPPGTALVSHFCNRVSLNKPKCSECLNERMHATGNVQVANMDPQVTLSPPLPPLLPRPCAGPQRAHLQQNPSSRSGVRPTPPGPLNPLQPRPGWGWGRSPPSGPPQPYRPTLASVLRTCQGHVSTLPNSEFLIMPNMLSLWLSGRTGGRGWPASKAARSLRQRAAVAARREGWREGRGRPGLRP
jgi:hypothetical protein